MKELYQNIKRKNLLKLNKYLTLLVGISPHKFKLFIFEISFIPAPAINPNIIIAAPPITESGIAAIIPPSFGNKPNKIKIIQQLFLHVY